MSATLAHGDFPIHLAGQTLCLAPTSVVFDFEEIDDARQAAARERVLQTLQADLTGVLSAANVNLEERASCTDADAFVLLTVWVRYLDPRTYIGFGEEVYSYDLSLQVGVLDTASLETASLETASSENTPITLQNLRFAASSGDIHSEGETGVPFEEVLEVQVTPLIGSLAAAWWEDNPPRTWRRFVPPLLGVLLSVLTVTAVLTVAKRRGRRPFGSSRWWGRS